MSLVVAARAAPETLKAVVFWDYMLTLGVTRAGVLASVATYEAAEALTAAEAEAIRIRVDRAEIYERTNPLLLTMAQLLGLAADQDDLDDHFRAAGALSSS